MGGDVRYDGHLRLPYRLPVRAEVLGTTDQVEIAGRELTLAWPVRSGDDRPLAAPTGRDAGKPWGSDTLWGVWESDRLSYIDAAAVSFSIEDGTGDQRREALAALSRAVEPWFAIAWDWVATWSGGPWRAAESVSSRITARTAGADANSFEIVDAHGSGAISVSRHRRVDGPDDPGMMFELTGSSSFGFTMVAFTNGTTAAPEPMVFLPPMTIGLTAEQLRRAFHCASGATVCRRRIGCCCRPDKAYWKKTSGVPPSTPGLRRKSPWARQ